MRLTPVSPAHAVAIAHSVAIGVHKACTAPLPHPLAVAYAITIGIHEAHAAPLPLAPSMTITHAIGIVIHESIAQAIAVGIDKVDLCTGLRAGLWYICWSSSRTRSQEQG